MNKAELRRWSWPLLAVLLLYGFDVVTHRSVLITPIDGRARFIALLLGGAIGAIYAWLIIARFYEGLGARQLMAYLCLPLLMAFLMYQATIRLGETLDFALVAHRQSLLNAPIVGTRLTRFGTLYANVQPFEGAREIRIPITWEVRDAFRSHDPASECLSLTIEEGRRKSLRAVVPNLFDEPLGADQLASCDQQ